MIDIAIHYRKAEKNTRPLYNTTPETGRNSLYCQRDPRHKVLLGLVQAQDPANDPQLFVDASVKPPESPSSTVRLGSRRDTFPLRNLPPEFSFLGTGDVFSNFGGSVSPGNINTSDNGNKSSSGNIGKGHCKRKKGKKTASLTSSIIATTTSNTEQNITDFPEKTVSSIVNKTETGPEYGGMNNTNGGSNTGMNTNNGGSSTGMNTNSGGSNTGMNTNNGEINNGMNTNNGGITLE
ncbi:expressed protein [Phakopsora pachyrhizi]|uniref:Expressed protein n=1 Tax=Phakopsora pachyrhizi TaxID=170000 RepID=A0AAV0BIB3_PHAPC|nr:expressed protein [Phakopsora pachyrhizi]